MKNPDPLGQPSRRDFLRIGAAGAIAASMPQLHSQGAGEDPASSRAATMINVPFERAAPRIGIIGTGGTRHQLT